MRYEEWVRRGGAITLRNPDPTLNTIHVPVTVCTIPALCSDGKAKVFNTFALIDTGATVSAIDSGVAKSLGLIPISKARVNGVHGSSTVDMFSFNMDIGDSLHINVSMATEGQFSTSEFKILIGMDILRLGEMYLGQEEKDGKCVGTIFSFSIPATGDSVDYVEKLNKARQSKMKELSNKN